MSFPWFLKHAPEKLEEIAGNNDAVEFVRRWALDWKRGKHAKPLLVFGPTGCGKTTLARVLAKEMNWVLVELNAGECTLESAKKISALSNANLFGSQILLFIDEFDAHKAGRIKGGQERESASTPASAPAFASAAPAPTSAAPVLKPVKLESFSTVLTRLLEEKSFPAILAADNAWSPKLAGVRGHCTLLELKRLNWRAVEKVLEKIVSEEKAECDCIQQIARASGGDLRAAINDLQVSCASKQVFWSERDRQENVFETLRAIFSAKNFVDAVKASNASEADLEMLLNWIEENAPREFADASEVASALEKISRANLFNSRVKRSQHTELLRYVRAIGVGGVSCCRKVSEHKFVSYKFPTVIKTLSESRNNRKLFENILRKVARMLHCSRAQARETVFLLRPHKNFVDFFGLSREEATLLSSF